VAAQEVVVDEEVEVKTDVVTNKPVALYIMFDRSQSMRGDKSTPEKWTPAVNAIKAFVDSDKSKDLDVALQYFPLSGGKCSDGTGYKTPAVAMGRLPAHAQDIRTRSTPTARARSARRSKARCGASPSSARAIKPRTAMKSASPCS
jgi:hypothetical protein